MCNLHEKCGGNPSNDFLIGLFKDMLQVSDLYDLGFNGTTFTWSNNQHAGDNIQVRLD